VDQFLAKFNIGAMITRKSAQLVVSSLLRQSWKKPPGAPFGVGVSL